MEAPPPRLSRSDFLRTISSHITSHYEPDADGGGKCRQCGSKIEQRPCYVSIHTKLFETCSGFGQVELIPLPFCPACEGPPKNDHSCIHE